MKKSNNKGFSLVELIVVVAIMAVLVGVLAPAYLRYVEKSRLQKDVSAIGEVVAACEVAMAEEDVYKTVSTTAAKITLTKAGTTTISGADGSLEAEVALTIPSVTLSSTKITANVDIDVAVTSGVVSVTVSGGGSDADWAKALVELNK